ncbi:hypothetical protein ACFLY9_02480, partial [Patescibacteria group bacterium]
LNLRKGVSIKDDRNLRSTIEVYSTKNWENIDNGKTDLEVAKFSLAKGLGDILFNSIYFGQKLFNIYFHYKILIKRRIFKFDPLKKHFINVWFKLPKLNLVEFNKEYDLMKKEFEIMIKDLKLNSPKSVACELTIDQWLYRADFTTSFARYLINNDLGKFDKKRNELIRNIMDFISKVNPFEESD